MFDFLDESILSAHGASFLAVSRLCRRLDGLQDKNYVGGTIFLYGLKASK